MLPARMNEVRRAPNLYKKVLGGLSAAAAYGAARAGKDAYSGAKRALAGRFVGGARKKPVKAATSSKKRRLSKKRRQRAKSSKAAIVSVAKQVVSFPTNVRYTHYDYGVMSANPNKQAWASDLTTDSYMIQMSRPSIVALLSKLRFYDPATPNTFSVVDMSANVSFNKFKFASYCKTTIRNRGQLPVHFVCYIFRAKGDGGTSPFTEFTNGITSAQRCSDYSGAAIASTSQLGIGPFMSKRLYDDWQEIARYEKKIAPGGEFEFSSAVPQVQMTFEEFSSISDDYSGRFNSTLSLMGISGGVCHDLTTNTLVGTNTCGIEYTFQYVDNVWYDGGYPGKYFIVDTGGLGAVATGKAYGMPTVASYAYAPA